MQCLKEKIAISNQKTKIQIYTGNWIEKSFIFNFRITFWTGLMLPAKETWLRHRLSVLFKQATIFIVY